MTTITRTTTHDIPDVLIEIVIEMAGYGIGYWATGAVVDDEARTYTVTDGGNAISHIVTYDALAEALVKVAYDEANVRSDLVDYAMSSLCEEMFPGGAVDSDLADVIVQVAALGEVVYG